METLSYTGKNNVVQAMPLRKGFINLTSGSFEANLIYCAIDGNITLNWEDGTETVVALVEGDSFTVDGADTITLNEPASSGKFHLA